MNRILLSLLLMAIVGIWGWTFVLVKDATRVYGELPFLAVRFAIGSCFMGALVLRHLSPRTLLVGGGIGVVLAVAFVLQTLGLSDSTVTNTAVITGLCVVFAPLVNRMLFGVKTPRVLWASIAASLIGLALLAGAAPTGVAPGDWLSLGCAVSFGLHIALLDRYAKHHHAGVLVLGQLIAATLLFGGVSIGTCPLTWPPATVWPALLICGIGATALAFSVQTFVQQRLSAAETALILLMEPVFAAVFGYLLHGDRLTGLQMSGGMLMLVAIATAELYPYFFRQRTGSPPMPADVRHCEAES
jgi:drug/metabolite transporter (DMT)-like permease